MLQAQLGSGVQMWLWWSLCLSVCLFLFAPLTLLTFLWDFILRQDFNGNKSGISSSMPHNCYSNSPGGKKASHFQNFQKKSWTESQRSNLCPARVVDAGGVQGIGDTLIITQLWFWMGWRVQVNMNHTY